ncbi:uncharacterized protein LOC141660687 [Apium graveolens]|uniref:uncharacterized protein LOC141660687 n=1 Tax=Apium graveolens TaxID=4045 RepID=UPI003D7A8935
MDSKRRVRGCNVENVFKNTTEPENQVVKRHTRGKNVDKNLINSANRYDTRHSVRTLLSIIDQSVTPEQGIRQLSKGVFHSGVAFAYMCRVAVNNKIGHFVTTLQSMIDQSVTPEQETVSSQFTRLKQQPQSVLKSPLSIFDENISHNISAASKSVAAINNRSMMQPVAVKKSQSCLPSPLSRFDQNISPNIPSNSKSVHKVRIRPKNFNKEDLGVFCSTLPDLRKISGQCMSSPNIQFFSTTNTQSSGMYSSSQTAEQSKNQFQRIISPNIPVKDMASDIEDIDEEYLSNNHSMWNGYLDLGAPDKICSKCDAVMWNHEKNNKSSPNKPPTFSLCCKNGQVVLDKEKQHPEPLATLLTSGVHFKHFKQNIRFYNCRFAMSSTGRKIDHSINRGGAPYCFKVQGVNYHNIGSLVPTDDNTPKFCQLYIYDIEDEINNRINAVNSGRDAVNEEIVQSLLHMLDEHNRLVKGFCIARERVSQNAVDEFKLVLISSSSASGRPNHIAPSNEVAGLIVTSPYAKGCRDIVIDSRVDGLQRIFETDPRFMQLQYPLLFPHGYIGYYREIPLNRPVKHSKRDVEVTESEDAEEKGLTPHLGGRLWQQYVVDAFTVIEQYRLDWIRDHQTTIRYDLYHNIRDAMQKGDRNPSNIGKAIILPASFTGRHPSLFLTMTTNTKWPEIQRILKHMSGVDIADAPDVVARVFKMKVDQLIDMIKKKNYFGRCIGVMHVIEFQKRGLPHAHILIWLHPDDRPKTTEQIDKMVSAEIPDPEIDPVGYNVVSNYMIHGPCGSDYTKSPCMVKGNYIKHFPNRYNSHTFFDECGFPIYKRTRTGITINKKGINLDNRFVVPFNRDLLGHDMAIMCLKKTRIGTSAIIPKKAPKERLPIHLPGEKHVSFKAGDVLEDVYDKAISKKTKLEAWKKGSRSFEDLKTVNGHIHKTFKEACAALGLQQNDNQWHEAIAENSHTSLPPQLRAMFVNILAYIIER